MRALRSLPFCVVNENGNVSFCVSHPSCNLPRSEKDLRARRRCSIWSNDNQLLTPKFLKVATSKSDANHRVVGIALAATATVFQVFDNSFHSQKLGCRRLIHQLAHQDGLSNPEWCAPDVKSNWIAYSPSCRSPKSRGVFHRPGQISSKFNAVTIRFVIVQSLG